jgi:hypothetical protein
MLTNKLTFFSPMAAPAFLDYINHKIDSAHQSIARINELQFGSQ